MQADAQAKEAKAAWFPRLSKGKAETPPARTLPDGTLEWCNKNGEWHREDGPAIIEANGTQHWYINGQCHRDGQPAVIYPDGTECWYRNGKLHREDGPAVVKADGTQSWYLHGERHREDGPAVVEANGRQFWYRHGKRHREDGPAVEHLDGRQEWYQDDAPWPEGPAIVGARLQEIWQEIAEDLRCGTQASTKPLKKIALCRPPRLAV